MQINIDRDSCCGAGQCVMLAPAVFDQDEEGIVVLLDENPPEALHPAVREAQSMCPTGVIWTV